MTGPSGRPKLAYLACFPGQGLYLTVVNRATTLDYLIIVRFGRLPWSAATFRARWASVVCGTPLKGGVGTTVATLDRPHRPWPECGNHTRPHSTTLTTLDHLAPPR